MCLCDLDMKMTDIHLQFWLRPINNVPRWKLQYSATSGYDLRIHLHKNKYTHSHKYTETQTKTHAQKYTLTPNVLGIQYNQQNMENII